MPGFALLSDLPRDARVADFHLHSSASDGAVPPGRVVRRAKDAGLRAISLTDHDTLAGLAEARAEAESSGILFINGIELSSTYKGRLVHILGHFVDPATPGLHRQVERYENERTGRMEEMLDNLIEMGLEIDKEDFYRKYGGVPAIGRGNVGAYLVEMGHVRTREEVFRRYLGDGAKAYVPLDMISPLEAVELIREAGGAATYAHPHLSEVDELVPELAAAGLAGLEVEHPSHDENVQAHYKALAERQGLLCMGGSDWHGLISDQERIGNHTQPVELVFELWERAGGRV